MTPGEAKYFRSGIAAASLRAAESEVSEARANALAALIGVGLVAVGFPWLVGLFTLAFWTVR